MEKFTLVLVDIRSTYNVGSIFRTADGFGLQTVYTVGITPHLKQKDDERLPHVIRKAETAFTKTALGAENNIKNKHFDEIGAATAFLKNEYSLIGLEQAPNSVKLPEFQSTKPIALFLGSEVEGLSKDILDVMDQVVEIPMRGTKNSFNVSIAAAIAMQHLLS